MTAIPIYRERYRLLTTADGPLGAHDRVTWAEAGRAPLCLLTGDMQNRRLVDQHLRAAGAEPSPALETNSMIVIVSHVRAGGWASIVPELLADALGPTPAVRSIPIVEPDVTHTIGLVIPHREPALPMVSALAAEARRLARSFDTDLPG